MKSSGLVRGAKAPRTMHLCPQYDFIFSTFRSLFKTEVYSLEIYLEEMALLDYISLAQFSQGYGLETLN